MENQNMENQGAAQQTGQQPAGGNPQGGQPVSYTHLQQGEHFPMDLDLMTDVLINLIDNGVKASEPGGKIILRAYERCIEVQDFGQGIPADEQEKIMEPFYMVDKSRSRKSGGAGLGLALTALIAKRHHITIRIDSKEGEGTRDVYKRQVPYRYRWRPV